MYVSIYPCHSPDADLADRFVQRLSQYVRADIGSSVISRQNSGYDLSHRHNVGTFVNVNIQIHVSGIIYVIRRNCEKVLLNDTEILMKRTFNA